MKRIEGLTMPNREPYKEKGKHYNKYVLIYMSEEQKNNLFAIAARRGESVSKIIREQIEKAGLLSAAAESKSITP